MKIGEFFEKHVQWIALGLAGVWLLWVGWTYGVNRPEVEIGGQKFSPASVDEHIRDTDMNALAAKLGNSNVPAMDVPDFTEAFASAMNGQPPAQIPILALRSDPQYSNLGVGPGTAPPRIWVVNEFPKVVVPTDVTVLVGRSLGSIPQNLPPILLVGANNKNNNANNQENGNG